MSAGSEARKHPVETSHREVPASPEPGEGRPEPVWAAMMDGLTTYIRDHERLYRLLAR